MQKTDASVVVLGTGGTIAGTAPAGVGDDAYKAAQLGVAQLLQAVPGLLQPIECEQVAQLDSKDMDFDVWLRLADRVDHHLARADVAGVVITHGTDTLEETAYFLHRVLRADKPVVLTAAMRPATSAEADGPRNLADAVLVARHAAAVGVSVVMAGQVFAALDVRKEHPTRLDAFGAGDAGPIAAISQGQVLPQRPWPVPATPLPALLPGHVKDWPRVAVLLSHAGADAAVVPALVRAGMRGLVVACTGNGTLHHRLQAALLQAQEAGVVVWRGTQCAAGALVSRPDEPFPSAGALTPVKARIALMLQLMD